MRGGSRRTWKSFDAVLVRVRRFRNDGRVAVTTMRAVPACSSGTLCLPSGREIRIWLRSTAVTLASLLTVALAAPAGASRAKSGTLLPFCSSAIVSVVNLAFGACACRRTRSNNGRV